MTDFRYSYKVISAIHVATVILLVSKVMCYPRGAPASVCGTGLPLHAGENGGMFQPQTTPPPYQINVDVAEFKAGDMLTVTIDSDQGTAFRGIFMQVRPLPSASDVEFRDKPLGRFFRIVDNTRPLTCDVSLESETHTDPFAKYNLTIQWRSPLLIRNDVVVRATLVANYSTFWTKVESPRIKIIPEEALPVEGLEKPWLREIIKTVSAEADKNATRELVKARFEKGFQNLIEHHGYPMVHYLTDMLPFEDSYPASYNATTQLPNVQVTGLTTDSGLEITKASLNITTDGTAIKNGTVKAVDNKETNGGHSKKLHYEALVKTLLKGDTSVVEELNVLTGEILAR